MQTPFPPSEGWYADLARHTEQKESEPHGSAAEGGCKPMHPPLFIVVAQAMGPLTFETPGRALHNDSQGGEGHRRRGPEIPGGGVQIQATTKRRLLVV